MCVLWMRNWLYFIELSLYFYVIRLLYNIALIANFQAWLKRLFFQVVKYHQGATWNVKAMHRLLIFIFPSVLFGGDTFLSYRWNFDCNKTLYYQNDIYIDLVYLLYNIWCFISCKKNGTYIFSRGNLINISLKSRMYLER